MTVAVIAAVVVIAALMLRSFSVLDASVAAVFLYTSAVVCAAAAAGIYT